MKDNSVSNFKIILYLFFSNLFFIVVLSFDVVVKKYNNNTWYTPLLMLVFYVLFIVLFYKIKSKNTNVLKKIRNSILLRMFIIFYTILQCCFLLSFSSIFLKHYFFNKTPIYFFIIATMICAIYISLQSFKNIITVASIVFIPATLLYIIPFISKDVRYISYLLPFSFDIKSIYIPLLLSTIPLDNILLTLYNNQIDNGLRKKDLLISGIILFLLLGFIFFENTTLISPLYFKDINLSAFIHWEIYQGSKFVSNYNIAVLLIMIPTFLFRIGINIKIARLMTFNSNIKLISIILGIICGLVSYLFFLNMQWIFNNMIILVSTFALLIVFIYLMITYKTRKMVF